MPKDLRASFDGPDGQGGHISEAGIQHRRVLPFQQAHPPVLVGETHSNPGGLFTNNRRSFGFVGAVDRGKHAGYCHGPHALPLHVARGFFQLGAS